MPAWAIPAIISGISALGGLLGNRSQKQRSYQTSSEHTDSSFNQSQNLFSEQTSGIRYDPYLYSLRQGLIDTANRGLQGSGDFANAFVQQQIANANKKANLANAMFSSQLASRGLAGSTMATAAAQRVNEENRVNAILEAMNTLPLVQRQADIESSQLANQIFSSIPKETFTNSWQGGDIWGGQSSTSNREAIGEQTLPGNMAGGLFGSLGSILAFLWARGAFR
jgi:hypothetical protein